jgi:Putative transmembrane protein 170
MQLGKGPAGWKYIWIIPLAYAAVAGIEALLAGSIVGIMYGELSDHIILYLELTKSSLGAVYNAGYFQMSTWIPFVWSLINVLVLILSSFSIQGGL